MKIVKVKTVLHPIQFNILASGYHDTKLQAIKIHHFSSPFYASIL